MGSQVLDASTLRGRFYHVPDCLRCDAIAPDLAQPTYSPEDRPTVDASRHDQLIDYPVLLADLEIFRSESHQFSATQSASDEQRHYRAITFAAQARGRRLPEQGLGLIKR